MLAKTRQMLDNPSHFFGTYNEEKRIYGGSGPPATIARELGQVRKEAAAACELCAGMWLGLPPIRKAAYKAAFCYLKPATYANISCRFCCI